MPVITTSSPQTPAMTNMFAKTASSIIASPHWTRGFAKVATRSPLNTRDGLKNAERVVIKVGTAVVSNSNGTLALSRMGALVEQIKELQTQGREVLLVSSGAVGLGRNLLGFSKEAVSDPRNVVDRQACAAAGQGILANNYNQLFQSLNMKGAQVLITQGDFTDPTKYKYLVETLDRLAALGTIPIINENDVVTAGSQLDVDAYSCFSDNDMLSALVASGAGATAVAMMTDVDGVFTKPPTEEGSERISVYTEEQGDVEIGEKSTMGRGGMASKIEAAQTAARGGVSAIVANGNDMINIERIFSGVDVGTLFPALDRPSMIQNWLAQAAEPAGRVTIKADALERLLRNKGAAKQLQMMDIVSVDGDFDASSPVEIECTEGKLFGKGLVQVDSADIEQSLGKKLLDSHVMCTSQMVLTDDAKA
eukprot:1982361-Rhodomonas_salina.2